jgi:hypothetical protein
MRTSISNEGSGLVSGIGEVTTQELNDLRIILIRFMADKEAHKKIPHLESRAPKLWDKVDRMYNYKQKANEDQKATNTNDSDKYFFH